jgi:2-amino-4-hydroxy-6-hydroxymethyldihydropteridine diphosphokinase
VDALAAAGALVEGVSGVYATAPQGLTDQPEFLNAACRVVFDGDPPGVLDVVKGIERALGRVAGPRFGPRAIDLDVLMWEGGSWSDARLEVPHPRLAERRFALVPLAELAPPAWPDGRTVAQALAALDEADQPVRATAVQIVVPGAPRGGPVPGTDGHV